MYVVAVYLIIVSSILSFLGLWFASVYKVLYRKRNEAYKSLLELQLHQNGYREKYGSPEEITASHMLDISVKIHTQIKESYNKTLKKIIYCIPGFLMGFRKIN